MFPHDTASGEKPQPSVVPTYGQPPSTTPFAARVITTADETTVHCIQIHVCIRIYIYINALPSRCRPWYTHGVRPGNCSSSDDDHGNNACTRLKRDWDLIRLAVHYCFFFCTDMSFTQYEFE